MLNLGHVFGQIGYSTVTFSVGLLVEKKILFPPAKHDFYKTIPYY